VGTTPGDAFSGLVELMRLLRSPDGCPWDREQTLDTLKPFVLEEAHEVIDAIERRDLPELRGEIGDLIFEGVFLAQLCSDEGHFNVTDALRDVHTKLVRRHPHVFGNASGTSPEGIDSPADVKGLWEQVKAEERAASGKPRREMFGGIPKTLPALLAAYEIGTRAAATGFEWPTVTEVLDKVEEEIQELRETIEIAAAAAADAADADAKNPRAAEQASSAAATTDGPGTPNAPGTPGTPLNITSDAASSHAAARARQEEELGDLLFALVNLSRKLGIEPEAALRAANRKFMTRFGAMQARLESRGRQLGEASLDEMEHAW
jgi:MazG family protein